MTPNQLGLDGFEEGLDGGVVVAISFATHGCPEPMLAQDLLAVVRTVLAPAISVMDAALGRRTESDSHLQCPDRKVTFHAIAYSPSNHAAGMQIQNHGQKQPILTRPDIGDATRPFLGQVLGHKVAVQQVWRDVELVVAVRCDLMFPRSHYRYAVLTHQTPNTSMADVQTDLFQFLSHARATVATLVETRLFFDMRQGDQIRSLPAAGWTTAECPQTAHADVHNLTKARCRKRIPEFFDEPKPHGFWLAKTCVAFLRNSHVSLTWQFL
mgnify:CR=1 FL=1